MDSSLTTIDSTTIVFECINHIHVSDGLSLGVLSAGDSNLDEGLEEYLQHLGLLIDKSRDTLD